MSISVAKSTSTSAKTVRSAQELRRIVTSKIGWIACGIALLLVIGPLLDIVSVVAYNG